MTPRQQRFVEEYLIDLNATAAARRAGYSAKTAEQQAARLLVNVKVAEAIAAAKAERSEKTKIDAVWVLTKAVALHELAIKKEELSPAARALELVGKHVDVQAFKERVEHGVTDDLADVLAKARLRAAKAADAE